MADKKDVTVSRTDPKLRAEIEAKRGIVRDAEGKIVRSKAWKKDRVKFLEAKLADNANREKNIKAELASLKKELA